MIQCLSIRSCAGLAVMLSLGLGSLRAEEPAPAKPADSPVVRPGFDPSHRVPPHFGQIGLTPEQRATIYTLRGKHQEKIDALEKQIAEARAQMMTECEGVLTEAQKQLLEQRRRPASRAQGKPSATAAKPTG